MVGPCDAATLQYTEVQTHANTAGKNREFQELSPHSVFLAWVETSLGMGGKEDIWYMCYGVDGIAGTLFGEG